MDRNLLALLFLVLIEIISVHILLAPTILDEERDPGPSSQRLLLKNHGHLENAQNVHGCRKQQLRPQGSTWTTLTKILGVFSLYEVLFPGLHLRLGIPDQNPGKSCTNLHLMTKKCFQPHVLTFAITSSEWPFLSWKPQRTERITPALDFTQSCAFWLCK